VADTSTFLIFFFLKRVKSKIQKIYIQNSKRGQVPKDPKAAYISMVGVQVTKSSRKRREKLQTGPSLLHQEPRNEARKSSRAHQVLLHRGAMKNSIAPWEGEESPWEGNPTLPTSG
jgi:hypothetical protein